jgi:hypothetical protein
MSGHPVMHKLLDVIEAAEFKAPDEEFVGIGLNMLALAISRLKPEEREAALEGIEDFGTLRKAVQQFTDACARRSPEEPVGPLH